MFKNVMGSWEETESHGLRTLNLHRRRSNKQRTGIYWALGKHWA